MLALCNIIPLVSLFTYTRSFVEDVQWQESHNESTRVLGTVIMTGLYYPCYPFPYTSSYKPYQTHQNQFALSLLLSITNILLHMCYINHFICSCCRGVRQPILCPAGTTESSPRRCRETNELLTVKFGFGRCDPCSARERSRNNLANLEIQFVRLKQQAAEERVNSDFWRPTADEVREEENKRISLFKRLARKAKATASRLSGTVDASSSENTPSV